MTRFEGHVRRKFMVAVVEVVALVVVVVVVVARPLCHDNPTLLYSGSRFDQLE